MPTRNVNLTNHLDQLIEKGIKSGRFGNASEVVREALRLLEVRQQQEKAWIAWVKKEAKLGFDQIDAGDYTELNSASDIENFVNPIWTGVSAETAAERKPKRKNA
jgi:antitoxin ParD1/3/4